MIARVLAVLAVALLAVVPARAGTLVIVGGALADDNDAVYAAMVAAMPADAPDIVVIPAASGYPAGSAPALAAALARHGIAADRVRTVRVAMVDDPDTPDADESRWQGGAEDRAEIAKLGRAGLIWFSGGDQARTLRLLTRADGSDTPLLAAIRARLAAGAVVAGSSAGAAIMGSGMIACGSPETALTGPVGSTLADCAPSEAAADQDGGEPLVLTAGLGFLPHAIVDQHFSQRARLGRLVRALACSDAAIRTGYGIDENTALLVDLVDGAQRVLGAGTVTRIDPGSGPRRCEGAVLTDARLSRIAAEAPQR